VPSHLLAGDAPASDDRETEEVCKKRRVIL